MPEFPESTANSRRTRWSLPSGSRPTAWGAVLRRVRRKQCDSTEVGFAKTASSSSGLQSYRDRFGIPAATFIFNRKSRPDGAFSQISVKPCPIGKSGFGGIDKACFGISTNTTPRSEAGPRFVAPRRSEGRRNARALESRANGTFETFGREKTSQPLLLKQKFGILTSPFTLVLPLHPTGPRDRSP